jgi:hypothetical protein
MSQAAGHGAERHHQGIPEPRHLYLPAEALAADDRDVAEYCYTNVPKWNPMNVCSYHLQEAGATPEQELAFALATAIAVLDDGAPGVPEEDFPVVGRISFFVNAGIRFVTEMCKMRAFVDLWDEICETRYGVDRPEIPPLPLRRAGQFAGPDRAAAGKQRLPHPDRDAGRDAVEKGPRPRGAAAGLERGAGPAAPLGSAMVDADAADHGLSRPTCWNTATFSTATRGRRQGRRTEGGRARRTGQSTRWAARSPRSTT